MMNRVFIGLIIIMFLDRISTLPRILMQIMLVFGGFWKLSCDNILINTDSKIK